MLYYCFDVSRSTTEKPSNPESIQIEQSIPIEVSIPIEQSKPIRQSIAIKHSKPIELSTPTEQIPESVPKKIPAKDLIYRGELTSMDGVGYNFSDIDTAPFLKFHELNDSPNCNLTIDKLEPRSSPEKLLAGFHGCIDPIFENHLNQLDAQNFSLTICDAIKQCDNIGEYKNIAIDALENLHEIKWAVLPKCKDDNVMITLGIGHDVNAEVLLYRTLPNTKFYGADPIIEPNLQLYSRIGTNASPGLHLYQLYFRFRPTF
ncbi:unnamed protein product [Caenorhabditis angaria]|uniref:Methyltransferase FkbM domain-containing protein n=1 Tax=Caenorhabditis angaria TaxID=860376 RepID=A0A9P1N5C3_9PELO|nr:unnamed protein product [Caenorhabditis angaria]